MIYSVFDWNSDSASPGHYVYFEGPGEGLGVRPKARQVYGDEIGHRLEELLPELPSTSKMVGRGYAPKGRIAVLNTTLRGELGGLWDNANPIVENPWLTLTLWAGVIFGGYFVALWVGKRSLGKKR